MVSSLLEGVSSQHSVARVTAREHMATKVHEWNYWCQKFIREGREGREL
jgi:hypothetical protein